jgi:hypothetical protein
MHQQLNSFNKRMRKAIKDFLYRFLRMDVLIAINRAYINIAMMNNDA